MRTARLIAIVLLFCAAWLAGCHKAPAPTSEVVAVGAAAVPQSPDDAAWAKAPFHVTRLLPQDLVEPRLMKPSTPELQVQAISNGTEIAFRLTWPDTQADDAPGAGRFVDACAVQIPAKPTGEAPAPQMGQGGKGVEITYWRADWQASVDGRADSIKALYPNASIDHYPFEAAPVAPGTVAKDEMSSRYAPAQVLGNRRVGPRESPVESLIAQGPGTITKAPQNGAKGKGVRQKTGWSVVFTRPVPAGLGAGNRTQVAFAVWEGSQQEAGARKMRSGWIPLLLETKR